MTRSGLKTLGRPARATWIAGLLFASGVLLTSVNWWFLLLAAAGAFGPGLLREFGWLCDQDEFERQANYRAGYHAYVAVGMLAVILVAGLRSSPGTIEYSEELATLFLVTAWFAWLLSSLVLYWGTQKAVFRFLVSFGCGWLVFTIASSVGSEWTGWTALLLHPLLTVPFFGLAWSSRHWPRVTGAILLLSSVLLAQFFGLFRHGHLALINQAITFVLFIGPLLAGGIALLGTRQEE